MAVDWQCNPKATADTTPFPDYLDNITYYCNSDGQVRKLEESRYVAFTDLQLYSFTWLLVQQNKLQ